MTMRSRQAAALLALAFTNAAAIAQGSSATPREALASDAPAVVAQAATALRERAVGPSPADDRERRTDAAALARALGRWPCRDDEPQHADLVRLHLLDALLAYEEARVPGDALLPLLERPKTRAAALVLLCQDPRQNERALLAAFRAVDDLDAGHDGYALGSLLAKQRAPGFAAALLERSGLQLTVTVQPESPTPQGFDVLGMAGTPARPPGFPATPRYELQRGAMPAYRTEAVRCRGILPVAPRVRAVRTVEPDGQIDLPRITTFSFSRPHDHVSRWLARLGAVQPVPRTLSLRADDEQFVEKVTAARDRIASYRTTIVGRLRERGLLTADEAARALAAPAFVYDDRRGGDQRDLPKIPPR